MRTAALLVALGALSSLSTVVAAEGEGPWPGVDASLTYVGKYMANGMDVGDDEPSIQPQIILSFAETGLYFKYWASFPIDRDHDISDEHDIILGYSRNVLADSRWAMNVRAYIDYWWCPHKHVTTDIDGDAISARDCGGLQYAVGLSLPKLIELPEGSGSMTLTYDYKYWDGYWGKPDLYETGGTHIFGLDYAYTELELPIFVSTTLNYHEGAFGIDPSWSHVTLSVSSKWTKGDWYVEPSVNYQETMEDTLNDEDEFWFALSAGWIY